MQLTINFSFYSSTLIIRDQHVPFHFILFQFFHQSLIFSFKFTHDLQFSLLLCSSSHLLIFSHSHLPFLLIFLSKIGWLLRERKNLLNQLKPIAINYVQCPLPESPSSSSYNIFRASSSSSSSLSSSSWSFFPNHSRLRLAFVLIIFRASPNKLIH